MAEKTLFTTFYSFKGGVGRTLALVNTAVSLTQKGYSVIIWDMDIEAPGVQNIPFFRPVEDKIRGGFVDIVSDFRKSGYRRLNAGGFSDYVTAHPENSKLLILPAGRLDHKGEYSKKFNAIDWERLFGKKEKLATSSSNSSGKGF